MLAAAALELLKSDASTLAVPRALAAAALALLWLLAFTTAMPSMLAEAEFAVLASAFNTATLLMLALALLMPEPFDAFRTATLWESAFAEFRVAAVGGIQERGARGVCRSCVGVARVGRIHLRRGQILSRRGVRGAAVVGVHQCHARPERLRNVDTGSVRGVQRSPRSAGPAPRCRCCVVQHSRVPARVLCLRSVGVAAVAGVNSAALRSLAWARFEVLPFSAFTTAELRFFAEALFAPAPFVASTSARPLPFWSRRRRCRCCCSQRSPKRRPGWSPAAVFPLLPLIACTPAALAFEAWATLPPLPLSAFTCAALRPLACETFPLLLFDALTTAAAALLACETFAVAVAVRVHERRACGAGLRGVAVARVVGGHRRRAQVGRLRGQFPPLPLVDTAAAMLRPEAWASALLDSAACAMAKLPGLLDDVHVLPTPMLTVTPWTLTHESWAPLAGASAMPVASAPTVTAMPIEIRRARRAKRFAENALPMSCPSPPAFRGSGQPIRTPFGSQGFARRKTTLARRVSGISP